MQIQYLALKRVWRIVQHGSDSRKRCRRSIGSVKPKRTEKPEKVVRSRFSNPEKISERTEKIVRRRYRKVFSMKVRIQTYDEKDVILNNRCCVFCYRLKEHYAPTKSLKTLIFYSSAVHKHSKEFFFGNILVNRSYSLLVVSWVKRLKSPLDAHTQGRGEEGVSRYEIVLLLTPIRRILVKIEVIFNCAHL